MTVGSKSTVSRRDAGLRAPSSRVARSRGVGRPPWSMSRSSGVAADRVAAAGLGSVPSPAMAEDHTEQTVRRDVASDARAGGHGALVRPSRRSRPTPRPGCGGRRPWSRPLQLEGQLDLGVGGERRPARAGTGRGRPAPRRRASARPRNSSTVPNAALSRASARVSSTTVAVERAGVGEALAAAGDHPDADALGVGRRQRLHVAVEHLDLGVVARPTYASTCSPGPPGRDPARRRRAAQQVPRTISHRCRRRSWPAPAGWAGRRRRGRPGRPCRTCRPRCRSRCRRRRWPAGPRGRCR